MPISVGDSRTFYRGADGHQHGRRHGDLPARHDRLHLPRRRPDRRLRQPQLDDDRQRLRQAEGALPRQRRRQRPGLALLAHPGRDQPRPPPLRREARLPDDARLPDRPRRPRGRRPAAGHRAVPRHHRPGRPGLSRADEADGGAQPAPRRRTGPGAQATGFELGVRTPLGTTRRRPSASCASCARRWTRIGTSSAARRENAESPRADARGLSASVSRRASVLACPGSLRSDVGKRRRLPYDACNLR